jgi:hypothetical protein
LSECQGIPCKHRAAAVSQFEGVESCMAVRRVEFDATAQANNCSAVASCFGCGALRWRCSQAAFRFAARLS